VRNEESEVCEEDGLRFGERGVVPIDDCSVS
jgi:hypothetical protein